MDTRRRGDRMPPEPAQPGGAVGLLDELQADERCVLVLTYFGHYSFREVSELTGAPIAVVRRQAVDGLRRLAELRGASID